MMPIVRILPAVCVLTATPGQALAQTFVCHTIRSGETAALIALRLTGDADSYRRAWFYIVDPASSRTVSKARYDVILPGWRACIPRTLLAGNGLISQSGSIPIAAQRQGTRDLTQEDRARWLAYVCWCIALFCLIILFGWQRAAQCVQRRRRVGGVMRRFGEVFVRAFEQPLVRGRVGDRPIRARLRCAPGQERLDILIAPADGRKYPNLGDHRRNVEYDVDRIVYDLRHEPFVRQPLHIEGSWVVIPFQFKPDMQKEALL
jgi:hypothetical protein